MEQGRYSAWSSDTGRLVMLTLFINAGLYDFRIILRRRRWERLRIEKSDLRRVGILYIEEVSFFYHSIHGNEKEKDASYQG